MTLGVHLFPQPARLDLTDIDNFRSLKVVVHGEDRDGSRLTEALRGIGWVAGASTFLGIESLKGLAGGRAHDAAWLAEFDSMVAFARSKGWVDDRGTALEAHWESAQ
jgi:hypothetical protein